MRIFIVIEPSEHVKAKIFHEFERLQKKNLIKGKFIEKENIHLTLKFIGEISEDKLEEIKKRLREVNFKKFNCEVGKTGVFDEKYIRVIWVGLISEELQKLEKQISEKFPEFPSDYEDFSSHITTARVKSVINKEKLLEELKNIHLKKLDFDVNEFVLMKSELTKQGPIYRVIEKFGLK